MTEPTVEGCAGGSGGRNCRSGVPCSGEGSGTGLYSALMTTVRSEFATVIECCSSDVSLPAIVPDPDELGCSASVIGDGKVTAVWCCRFV